MLLSVNITEKSFGSNILYKNVAFEVQKDEKANKEALESASKELSEKIMPIGAKMYQAEQGEAQSSEASAKEERG